MKKGIISFTTSNNENYMKKEVLSINKKKFRLLKATSTQMLKVVDIIEVKRVSTGKGRRQDGITFLQDWTSGI